MSKDISNEKLWYKLVVHDEVVKGGHLVNLSAKEAILFSVYFNHADNDTGKSRWGSEALAKQIGVNRRNFNTIRDRLESRGLIKVYREEGKSNRGGRSKTTIVEICVPGKTRGDLQACMSEHAVSERVVLLEDEELHVPIAGGPNKLHVPILETACSDSGNCMSTHARTNYEQPKQQVSNEFLHFSGVRVGEETWTRKDLCRLLIGYGMTHVEADNFVYVHGEADTVRIIKLLYLKERVGDGGRLDFVRGTLTGMFLKNHLKKVKMGDNIDRQRMPPKDHQPVPPLKGEQEEARERYKKSKNNSPRLDPDAPWDNY